MVPHATSLVLVSPHLVKAPVAIGNETFVDDDESEEMGLMDLCLIECTICKSVSWNELLLKAAFLNCFSDGWKSKSSLAVKN